MSRPEKRSLRIENWRLVSTLDTDFISPEQIQTVMLGTVVHGGARIPVQTSEVIWFSHTSGIAETRNTLYNLGQPDPEWIEQITAQGYTLDRFAIEKEVQ